MSNHGPRRWPGSTAFRGAATASAACAFLYCGYFGATSSAGLGKTWEIAIALFAGAIAIMLFGLLHGLAILIGRKLDRLFAGYFISSLSALFSSIPIPSSSAIFGSLLLVFLINLFGYRFPIPFAILADPILLGLQATS